MEETRADRYLRYAFAAMMLLAVVGYAASRIMFAGGADVAIVERTRSYHREECAKTRMADVRIVPFTPAVKAAYKPCPYCKPDTTP